MPTTVFSTSVKRPIIEASLSQQTKVTNLQNTFRLVALRQPEMKQRSLISHETKDQLLFPLYFTSLQIVPVFTETLRKYPTFPFLDRITCCDYKLPAPNGNGTIILPAGTGVYIPVYALHHDKTYYPQPEKFDPDRFTEENINSRPKYTYIPFGEGPRMCIGKGRYLIVPSKNFRFQPMRIGLICS